MTESLNYILIAHTKLTKNQQNIQFFTFIINLKLYLPSFKGHDLQSISTFEYLIYILKISVFIPN